MTESNTTAPAQTFVCQYAEATDDLDSCQDGTIYADNPVPEGFERIHGEHMWRVGRADLSTPDGNPLIFAPVCSYHPPWLLALLYETGEGPQLVVPLDGLTAAPLDG